MTYSSVGYFVNKEDIVIDESLSMSVAGRLTFLATGKKRFSYLFALIGIFVVGWMILDIDYSMFTNWHEVKSAIGFDYNLTEKLDDAPYEVAAVSSEPKELEARTDAGTVALDIIERADGKGITTALDIIQDETVSYVLLDRQEALLIKTTYRDGQKFVSLIMIGESSILRILPTVLISTFCHGICLTFLPAIRRDARRSLSKPSLCRGTTAIRRMRDYIRRG